MYSINKQEELKNVFESYLKDIKKFNDKGFAQAGRRARMALSSMVPLIKQIRKEISIKKKELNFMKEQAK